MKRTDLLCALGIVWPADETVLSLFELRCLSPVLMQIEKEEEKVAQQDPDKQCFHLCIVNLVIGTLYCAKVSKNCVGLSERMFASFLSDWI